MAKTLEGTELLELPVSLGAALFLSGRRQPSCIS